MTQKMDKQEQNERLNIMARVYAETNSSEYLALAKSMRGAWYYYTVPMTAENVRAAMSTCEHDEKEGYKARFRPSNGAFYRLAYANNIEPIQFATDTEVEAVRDRIERQYGTRANKGIAVECILYERITGEPWSYNPTQAGFWAVPDATSIYGEKIQIKAYGGSVTAKDLETAVQYCKTQF